MNINDIKPTDLKRMAEDVGHKAKATSTECTIEKYPFKYMPDMTFWVSYNPFENAEQSQELQVRGGFDIVVCSSGDFWVASMWQSEETIVVRIPEKNKQIETYRQLIVDAFFKDLENGS